MKRPPTFLRRFWLACSLLALATTAQAQLPRNLQLDLGQPTHELGQVLVMTIRGLPGTVPLVLADPEPGQTCFPKIGCLALAFSPGLIVQFLPPLPGLSGGTVLHHNMPCEPAYAGFDLTLQLVGFDPATGQPSGISNPDRMELVDGDCQDGCDGGIVMLGVQTSLPGIGPGPGTLILEAREKKPNGKLIGTLSVSLDPGHPGALPLSNADGSITLTLVELLDGEMVVRYEVDPLDKKPGKPRKLSSNTWFAVSFEGALAEQIIHTSCSQPIAVGWDFGPFTITNLIDKN